MERSYLQRELMDEALDDEEEDELVEEVLDEGKKLSYFERNDDLIEYYGYQGKMYRIKNEEEIKDVSKH